MTTEESEQECCKMLEEALHENLRNEGPGAQEMLYCLRLCFAVLCKNVDAGKTGQQRGRQRRMSCHEQ